MQDTQKPTKVVRAALYARVSTRDQNLDLQKERLVEFCRHRNWEVVRMFEDTASGKNIDRPGFREMMNAISVGGINAVVIYKLDRIGRSLRDLLHIVDTLEKDGVALVSITNNIDTTTNEGRLFFYMAAAFTEYEREIIKDRCDAGKERAKLNGVKFGRPKKEINIRSVMSLIKNGVPKAAVARQLKISRKTLYERIDEYELSLVEGMEAVL